MRKVLFVALLILASSMLPLSERSLGQEQSAQKITFHVTAVRSEETQDYCTSGNCSATRFTVEGYSDVKGDSTLTEYVLDCVEIMAYKPSLHFTVVCARLHANNDYDARLSSDTIAFGEGEKTPSGALVADYRIVSEKEVNRQKR